MCVSAKAITLVFSFNVGSFLPRNVGNVKQKRAVKSSLEIHLIPNAHQCKITDKCAM